MATLLVHHPVAGKAMASVTVSDGYADFILNFANDLAAILTAVKENIGLLVVYNRIVPAPSKGAFAMIRFDSDTADPIARTAVYSFQIIIGRARNKTAQANTPSDTNLEFTYECIRRLLIRNGNFNRLGGITRLAALSGAVAVPGMNIFVDGKNLEEAVINVAYVRDEPQLYTSNR